MTLLTFMSAGFASKVYASPFLFEGDAMIPSYSDFGDTGLLQMPNARMMPDGEMAVGTGFVDPYRRHFVNFQFLPWFEGVFRYTAINGVAYNAHRDNQSYKDKSFDIKLRLLREREFFPQLALGFRDIGGTELFSSEYLALSKRYLNLDLTFGLGFGNMGTRDHISNPFKSIFGDSFRTRSRVGGTGKLKNSFFKGEKAGFFGGIEYQTAYKPIRLKLEYDGNNYTREKARNDYVVSTSPINYGVQYSPFEWLDVTLAYERGEKMMLRGNLRTNFNNIKGMPKFDEKPAPTLIVRDRGKISEIQNQSKIVDNKKPQEITSYTNAVESLFDIVESKGLEVRNIAFDDNTIQIYIGLRQNIPPTSGDMAMIANGVFNSGISENLEKIIFIANNVNNSEREIEAVYYKKDIKKSIVLTGSPVALAPPLPASWFSSLRNAGFETPEQEFANKLFSYIEKQGLLVSKIFVDGEKVRVNVTPRNHLANTAVYDLITAGLNNNFSADISEICFVEFDEYGSQIRTVSRNIAPRYSFAVLNNKEALAETKRIISRSEIKKIAHKIFEDLAKIDFKGIGFDIKEGEATLYFSQTIFRNSATAIGRASVVVANNLPPDIEVISLVLVKDGLAATKTTLFRKDLEKMVLGKGSPEEIIINTNFKNTVFEKSETAVYNKKLYPELSFSFEPKLRQHIGGGDNFYFWQIFGKVNSNLAITKNLSVSGSLAFDIVNNFDKMETKPSDSILPHVRSDVPLYIKGNKHWIDNLNTSYVTNLAPDWYARASAGIFEMMFVGFGGEVLYRPVDKNFAVGLDINRVKQRDYSGYFKMLDYQTTTGHLSFYNKWSFYNIETIVRIGKYLAKDNGATLEVSRRFNSGVIVGAFATKTDISTEEFGEGSFDKGIYLMIPFDLFSTKSTTSMGGFSWRPLSRDGGQRIVQPKPLYEITSDVSKNDISKNWSDVLK